MSDSEQITIDRLKIFILGISPTIWRRINVRSDNTISDLQHHPDRNGLDRLTSELCVRGGVPAQ